jgi:hypothetical protein
MCPRVPSSPRPVPLHALVEAAAVELSTAGVEGALLRVLADPADGGGPELAWIPLDGAHPLELLLRLAAPPHWRAVGVSCSGRAHPLDARGRTRRGPHPPSVTVTLLVDRAGESAGLLREGQAVTALPGRPEGLVADACRRAFGLPTTPPPPSTAELWALYWLDRIVEVGSRAGAGPPLRTWAAVAGLHPAVDTAPPPGRDPTPAEVAALARSAVRWAAAWPWARLRAEPATLDLPWLDRTPALAAWMDDGMWARWLLSGLPHGDDLRAAVHDLVCERLAAAIDEVVTASCGGSGSR